MFRLNVEIMPGYISCIGILMIAILFSCSGPSNESLHFNKIPSSVSGLAFANKVVSDEDMNVFTYRNFYNGGGVGIGDINNDGLADVLFTANQGSNKLYLNKGDWQFEDISEQANIGCESLWSTGVSFIDINKDGWLDIYICNAGYKEGQAPRNALFINQKDNTFIEKASSYGLDDQGYTTHAAFFDYDLDGDLDVYILNNSFIPVNSLNYNNRRDLFADEWPVQDFLKGGGDKLLRNESDTFVDVTQEAGLFGSLIGFGLGITVEDFNGDNWLDLYISNDFYERDYLYMNQGDGTFKEDIMQQMGHISLSSMGADAADINNDGYSELFVTEMLPDDPTRVKTKIAYENYSLFDLKVRKEFHHQYMQNTLQLNNGNETFSEIAWYSGVAASDWSWGALMFDADNDGYSDIYVCNGVYKDVTDQDFIDFFANTMVQEMVLTGEKDDVLDVIDRMPTEPQQNKLFLNQKNLTFKSCAEEFGLQDLTFSNGAAYGDLDNDGDLDLVVNNLNQEATLYENNSRNHYLSIYLSGSDRNPFAIGSKVKLYHGDQIQIRRLIPSRGFQSSVDYKMVFGLDSLTSVDSIEIQWPDLSTQIIYSPPIDTLLHVVIKKAGSNLSTKPEDQLPQLNIIANDLVEHKEDEFIDFFNEGLLIKQTSQEGPALAKRDINKDGYVDMYIGGAHGQAGKLYLGGAKGFRESHQVDFEQSKNYEDTYAIFEDVDNDGWHDLIVGSGGNFINQKRLLQDRIYLNDGRGIFKLKNGALSQNAMNTSVIIPIDFDADGDKDLILASRSYPSQYGIAPLHYFYVNDGNGGFRNGSQRFAEAFRALGMVTDAAIDSSQQTVVFVGEWMSPMSFTWDENGFKQITTSLDSINGWWYSIEIADLDNDTYPDYILGNRGLNFPLKASNDEPAKMWIGDYDGNGGIDRIITEQFGTRDIPVVQKRELTAQLLFLKKENLLHADYANKSIDELIPLDQLERGNVLTVNSFESQIAWGSANHTFQISTLPIEVQLSCIKDILIDDFNEDGIADLILVGNDRGFIPQFSKLDASYGNVVINNGNRTFFCLPSSKTGFRVKGDSRIITKIDDKILVLRNNDGPVIFEKNQKSVFQ